MMLGKQAITKVLSPNDTGENGTHQAGILVPKGGGVLEFFPTLDRTTLNPRVTLTFTEDQGAQKWKFEFIYYNNKFFGGTRNEFRLTGMTKYFRVNNLKAGDELILEKQANGGRSIGYSRQKTAAVSPAGVLKLGSGWKVISLKVK
jgi:hypothetical protein